MEMFLHDHFFHYLRMLKEFLSPESIQMILDIIVMVGPHDGREAAEE